MRRRGMARFAFVILSLFKTFVVAVTEDQPDNIEIKATVTRGMIIDAGSGGSRLHVYHWQPRIFNTIPPDLSYPTTDEQWTARMAPGIAEYKDNPEDVKKQLAPLIDFATRTLVGLEENFQYYPIYFKATGGMRELNLKQREEIMIWVRFYLSDKNFCPFYFHDDFARVISGEEEAIYSWTAINFLKGDLLTESKGVGPANGGKEGTFGTLDLGGASSQIAFYVKNQDISENLFKLQIGGQKHWNVYTKSFLSFGHVSARKRHLLSIADATLAKQQSAAEVPSALSYCFHAGYTEIVEGTPRPPTPQNTGKKYSKYSNPNVVPYYQKTQVEVSGPAGPAADQFDRCLKALRPLLEKDHGHFCMLVYDGECSIDGAYQPILPDDGRFIGTSSYILPWEILVLPDTASLDLYRMRAENICAMSFNDVLQYYEMKSLVDSDSKLAEMLPYFCFLSSYAYVLLVDGYGFKHNSTITVLDQVNGNKVGWPLGAILYEINSLPWEMEQVVPREPWGKFFLAAAIGLLFGALASFFLSKELHYQSRQPLIVFPTSTGSMKQSDYTTVYPPDFSYDVDEGNGTSPVSNDKYSGRGFLVNGVSKGSSGGSVAICNKIDSRKPFSAEECASSPVSSCEISQSPRGAGMYSRGGSESLGTLSERSTTFDIEKFAYSQSANIQNANSSSKSAGLSISGWSSDISQYNPFLSKDKYQRVPEVPNNI